jgi:hypothetical protein
MMQQADMACEVRTNLSENEDTRKRAVKVAKAMEEASGLPPGALAPVKISKPFFVKIEGAAAWSQEKQRVVTITYVVRKGYLTEETRRKMREILSSGELEVLGSEEGQVDLMKVREHKITRTLTRAWALSLASGEIVDTELKAAAEAFKDLGLGVHIQLVPTHVQGRTAFIAKATDVDGMTTPKLRDLGLRSTFVEDKDGHPWGVRLNLMLVPAAEFAGQAKQAPTPKADSGKKKTAAQELREKEEEMEVLRKKMAEAKEQKDRIRQRLEEEERERQERTSKEKDEQANREATAQTEQPAAQTTEQPAVQAQDSNVVEDSQTPRKDATSDGLGVQAMDISSPVAESGGEKRQQTSPVQGSPSVNETVAKKRDARTDAEKDADSNPSNQTQTAPLQTVGNGGAPMNGSSSKK